MAEEEDSQKITKQDINKKHKKKRENKIKSEEEEDTPMEISNHPEEEEPKKKKKKKKRRHEEEKDDIAPVEMKIEMVNSQPEKIPPFVGYFPSGFNPQKSENGVEINAYRKRPHRYQLAVTPKGSNVNFVGKSHSGEAEASQVCTYALCVVDKLTHTLQIVPIAANKILRLEPVIGGLDSPLKEPPKEENATANKFEQINKLTVTYSTKKNAEKVKKDANLNRKIDAKSQKDFNDKVDKVQVNKEGLGTSSGNQDHNIPPHDSNADTPAGAYPLDRIILKGEWDYLLDILELVESGAEMTPNTYPRFVFNRIHKLQEIQDEEDKKKLACIYSYIAYLIKFKEHLSAGHTSTPARIPHALYVKFSALFGRSGQSPRPDERTDLLISYVLVLTLIADAYLTDPSDIAADLKMMKTRLKQHYVALGCKTQVVGGASCYTLPIPLNLPNLKPNNRKRRR